MCGIAGKLSFVGSPLESKENFQKIALAIKHRGPDSHGTVQDGPVILGNRRLAIIDLSEKGNQPMANAAKTVWITFNGEIYNFESLRKELEKKGATFISRTDTEVIIHLYEKYDLDCLKYLRGQFAFAIWDKRKQRLFIARDRVGEKPLKYYVDDSSLIFASELKAILKDSSVKREPDFEAIHHYLTYQYVPSPRTGFQNIKKLPAGHYLLAWPDGKVESKRYWEIDYSKKLDLSEENWQKKILEKLEESVASQIRSDVPWGAFLSGGIDSSLVVAFMARHQKEPVKTFSIGFKEDAFNELPYAAKIAEQFKTEHREFIVKPEAISILPELVSSFEEPFADSSALPTWYLSQLTRKYVTVALAGDGGDENFAGYTRYQYLKLAYLLRDFPRFFPALLEAASRLFPREALRHRLTYLFSSLKTANDPERTHVNFLHYFGNKEKAVLYNTAFREKMEEFTAPDSTEYIQKLFNEAEKKNIKHWLDRALFVDFNSYLPDDLLVKTDIASMAHALEVRVPFLDHEFLELTSQIPAELKLKGFKPKYILKKAAEKILPREIVYRKKQGFAVPLSRWFRQDLAAYSEKLLLASDGFGSEFFERDFLQKLLRDHQNGKHDYSRQLWALVTLEHWWRRFFT
jgi:asparagine synthase (glutamine-hydrolysing)